MGPQADVYPLGAILYCLLTGRPPFLSASALDTLVQIMESQPLSPKALNPQIAADIDTICLKCLEKRQSHRYGSTTELEQELRNWLEGFPIRARRADLLTRSGKWVIRNRAASSFLGLLAIVFLLFSQTAIADLEVYVEASENVIVVVLVSTMAVSAYLFVLRGPEIRFFQEFVASLYACTVFVIAAIGLMTFVVRFALAIFPQFAR
jgi:hypothetical protein